MREVPVRWRWDLVFALAIGATFAYAVYEAQRWAEEASLFPMAVALPGLALAAAQVVISVRGRSALPEPAPAEDAEPLAPAERSRRTAEIASWILGFFATVYLLGFHVAVPLVAAAYLRIAAREGWLATTAVAAGCWALVFGVFDRLLHVPLPAGELLKLFGLS